MSQATDAPAPTGEPLIGSLLRFFSSSIGSKVVMALTGAVLWGFLLAHLGGNLMVYFGPETYNHYAQALKGNAALLWAVRGALIAAIPLHFWAAVQSSAKNSAARPVAYAYANRSPARTAAKSMLVTGLVIAAFFVYHLAHFTWHVAHPEQVKLLPSGEVDVYSMLVNGFSVWWISAIYVVAQLLLAQHLSHGIYSLFQHLGLYGASWTPFLKRASLAIGYGLCAAFISIPVAVLLGVVKLP
ncbi:MAG: succinate dehydrogenase cytochrome b subunit [Myxococcaceae bacterium]|nr:succinate dehydrogenase cytochrome b subunit [Myxococcaceae bacterium]